MQEIDTQTSLLKVIAKHTRDLHYFMADQQRNEEQRIADIRTANEREKRLLKRLDKIRFWLIVLAIMPIISLVLGFMSGALSFASSFLPVQ